MPADLTNPERHAGYRFPTAVIHHALWLMNRFNLSLRVVQEILFQQNGEQMGFCLERGQRVRGKRRVARW